MTDFHSCWCGASGIHENKHVMTGFSKRVWKGFQQLIGDVVFS